MKKIFVSLILLVFVVINIKTVSANGVSFYQRVLKERKGKLEYPEKKISKLPDSQRQLLSCRSIQGAEKWKACVNKTMNLLKKEIESENELNSKSWKYFLRGTIRYERQDFSGALVEYQKALDLTTDKYLKSAILHRLILTQVIKREIDQALDNIKRAESISAEYDYFDIFNTYPESLCDAAWDFCGYIPSLEELQKWVPVLTSMLTVQQKLSSLASEKPENVNQYSQFSLKLAELYETVCPIKSMFETVCPDSLAIYTSIHSRSPDAKGADYAFLRIQQSKFAYEYEGDEIALSKDMLKLYRPFLEKYPNSPHFTKIKAEYVKAEKILSSRK